MKTRILLVAILLPALAAPGMGSQAGPAAGLLDQAERAFDETLKEARAKLLEEFDRAIREYTQSGHVEKAETVRKERSQFLASLAADTFPREQKPAKLTPAELDVYTGRYIYGPDKLLEVKREDEKLTVRTGETTVELTSLGDHRFVDEREPKRYTFLVGPEGKARDLVISDERKCARRLRTDEWDVIRIRAFVGKRARLILRGNTAQWFHQTGNAPGRLPKTVEPVAINGVAWHPVWPDVPNWHNPDAYCHSDIFTQVEPALPATEGPVYVVLTEGRGRAFVLQEPTEANGYAQIISFESEGGQGNGYEAELWFPKAGRIRRAGVTPAQSRPAAASGLLAHYPLDGDAKDASGSGYHGRLNGPTPTTDRFGKENAALYFDGNGYIEIAPPPKREAASPMSVSLWANYDDQPSRHHHSQALLAQDGRWEGQHNRVYHLSGFRGRIVQHFFWDWRDDLSSTRKVAPGTWYHITTVFDGRAHWLYIDGTMADGKVGELAASPVQPFCIGTMNSWRRELHFRGRIDDVRIYSRALSREEIAALYRQGGFGDQSLLDAASRGETDKAKQLLARGAKVNVQDKYGRTPLHLACGKGHVAITELLLSKGADPNLKDADGNGALHAAAAAGSEKLAASLLARGARVNDGNRYDKSPLHLASAFGHLAIVKSLIANHADVHAADAAGYTPLHRAAMYGRKQIAKLLLASGAKALAKDKEGRTALERARELKRQKCVALLSRPRNDPGK